MKINSYIIPITLLFIVFGCSTAPIKQQERVKTNTETRIESVKYNDAGKVIEKTVTTVDEKRDVQIKTVTPKTGKKDMTAIFWTAGIAFILIGCAVVYVKIKFKRFE